MTAHTTAIVVTGDAINVKPKDAHGGARVEFPNSGVTIVLSPTAARYLAAGLADVTRPKIVAVPDEPRRIETDTAYIPDEDDEVGPNVNKHGVDMTPGSWPMAGAL